MNTPPHNLTINAIHLPTLLSTTIDSCRRGCEVIRSVRARSSNSAAIISHTYKLSTSHNTVNPLTNAVEIDPRSALTEADEASQVVVVECLKSCWGEEMECRRDGDGEERPRLKLVGEEDTMDSFDEGEKDGGGSGEVGGSQVGNNNNNNNSTSCALFEKYNTPHPDGEPVTDDLFGAPTHYRTTQQTASDDLIVFIDPLDGTREYIENRIHNVQCLIGITCNGIPIAGAVGLPFGTGAVNSEENEIEVAYGMVMPQDLTLLSSVEKLAAVVGDGKKRNQNVVNSQWNVIYSGVKCYDALNRMSLDDAAITLEKGLMSGLDAANEEDDETLVVLSGDSKKPALQMAMDCLEKQILVQPSTLGGTSDGDDLKQRLCPPYRKIISGGCGNKILYLGRRHQQLVEKRRRQHQTNDESATATSTASSPQSPIVGSISIAPPGSSSWDTAAPTAVLLAMDTNSLVTDLVGRPLIYDGIHLTNECGVVVSSGEIAVGVHRELCGRLARDESFCMEVGVEVDTR
ncbi:predicted protein [Thalassiosira pseudonana CCMP1335]|uniref:3'(2'),5'-bisphosphate nucleotidase n=1 Tax=Thalassiosira pseudonana TaxID=35128 RepID=B8C589_THAPS|nr:predicted protein [Thalassiosira pseudonana CCMP1335]EED91077.1 predicted protein [Thalassiosira pseudonana CCMP1335]|eukprot:scaffold759_cov290-Alexandrium_tamarense.AAC.28